MKRSILVTLVVLLLVTACGGDEATPAPTTVPQPTSAPSQTEAPPPPATDTLDYTLAPNFGETELESGFLPDPFEVEILSGGYIDISELDLGTSCTGFATAQPDFRVQFSGQSLNLRFFFVPAEEGEDTTLVINDPQSNWHCNDDYDDWNPLVDIENPAAGQFDIWVGSYGEADEFIAGTLYITELDLSPEDFSGAATTGESIAQWAISATASSEFSNPNWSALQATGAPDTDECGDIQTAWASATSDGVDWLELVYSTPVIPTQINIYETNSPGFINEIEVIDESGMYYSVWTGETGAVDACPRIFSIDITGGDFPIVGVRVNLDQSNGGIWNEIDAVELVGYTE